MKLSQIRRRIELCMREMQSCQPSRFWRKAHDFRAENTSYDFTLRLPILELIFRNFHICLSLFLHTKVYGHCNAFFNSRYALPSLNRLNNMATAICARCHALIGITWKTELPQRNKNDITNFIAQMQHFYHISFTSGSIIYTMINNLYILNLNLAVEYASNCSAYVSLQTDTSGRRPSDPCLTIFYFEMLATLLTVNLVPEVEFPYLTRVNDEGLLPSL